MSQAAQIILDVPNPFTSKPSFTYFETKYENTISSLGASFDIPFDNQNLEFGSTYECTIPKYGDVLTSVFLRATLPAIYTPQSRTYVYPKPASTFPGTLYVQQNILLAIANGQNLDVSTYNSHFFSIGNQVLISGTKGATFNLDGVYTIMDIPTPTSFICSTTVAGISFTGKVSAAGIQPSPVVGYYSTQNINLWSDKIVNLPYTSVGQTLTDPIVQLVPGQSIQVFQSTNQSLVGQTFTVDTSTANTYTLVTGSLVGATSSIIEIAIDVVYDPGQNKFVFASAVYPAITFASAQDAAFWGFDYLQGPSFPFVNGLLTSQWTLPQGGWVQGFLPPSLSSYDDSVANKLIKEARILLGRQVIKRYTGEYLELTNDLEIPYENKAILKLMNGTLDFTQAVAPREYYVPLPLGCDSIPICALTRQQISVEIDFEDYRNLSNNINPGSGDFFDPYSYLTYNVSQNIIQGGAFNVSFTLSYQQYILILTFSGIIIVYDTSKPIDATGSYSVITGFYGVTSVFVNLVALGDVLYIQLQDGSVLQGLLSELVLGNTSSFILNNYLPTIPEDVGLPTGSMVCDFRYLYYAQSNLAQSNVFFVRYDTKTPFRENTGYTSFDFTANVNSTVSSVYQMLSTGQNLVAIPNSQSNLYTFNLNGNFLTDWKRTDYSSYGLQITEGVLVQNTVYFVLDNYKILTWTNGTFGQVVTPPSLGTGFQNLHAVGTKIYASSSTACVITLDTTQGLAAQYYPPKSPFLFTNNKPFIFANGPRFVYIMTNDASKSTTPTNVIRYDPYTSTRVLQASIIADYKILPGGTQKPTGATIKYVQNQHVTGQNFADLQLLGPIKELIVTGVASVTNVYQYANLASNLSLTITGHEEILTPDVGTNTALQTITPFQYHTSMPIRNISVLPFEINPESTEPNGTVNFSRLQYQLLSNGSSAWASSYNILKIGSGIGGLEFNSPY
jgi:hypothetical protein